MAARALGVAAQHLHVPGEIAAELGGRALVALRAAALAALAMNHVVDQRPPAQGVLARQPEVEAGIEAEHPVCVVRIEIEASVRDQRFQQFAYQGADTLLLAAHALGRVLLAHHPAPLAVSRRVHRGEGVRHGLAEQQLRRRGAGRPRDIGLVVHAGFPDISEARQRPGVVLRDEMRASLVSHRGVKGMRVAHRGIGKRIIVEWHRRIPCADIYGTYRIDIHGTGQSSAVIRCAGPRDCCAATRPASRRSTR